MKNSLIEINEDRRCLVYCGDDACVCSARPIRFIDPMPKFVKDKPVDFLTALNKFLKWMKKNKKGKGYSVSEIVIHTVFPDY